AVRTDDNHALVVASDAAPAGTDLDHLYGRHIDRQTAALLVSHEIDLECCHDRRLAAVDGTELGRGAAPVKREDMFAVFAFAEQGTHQDAGGGSRLDDAHREIAGDVGRDEAAARLHDEQVFADAALQKRAFQMAQVAVHDRLYVSVGDGRVG